MKKVAKNQFNAAKISHEKKAAAEREVKKLAKLNNLLFKEFLGFK